MSAPLCPRCGRRIAGLMILGSGDEGQPKYQFDHVVNGEVESCSVTEEEYDAYWDLRAVSWPASAEARP